MTKLVAGCEAFEPALSNSSGVAKNAWHSEEDGLGEDPEVLAFPPPESEFQSSEHYYWLQEIPIPVTDNNLLLNV